MIRIGVIAGLTFLVSTSLAMAQGPNEKLPGPPSAVPVTAGGATAANLPGGLGTSIYSVPNIGQFLPVCDADRGACADEVGTALIDKMALDGSASMCLPGPDYSGAALDYLKAHPEMNGMKTEDGIYQALLKVYSC